MRCLIFIVCPTISQRNISSKITILSPCSFFLLLIVELLILRSLELPWIIMNKMLTKITIHTLGFVPSSAKIISIMFYVYPSNISNKVMIYFLKRGMRQSITTTLILAFLYRLICEDLLAGKSFMCDIL